MRVEDNRKYRLHDLKQKVASTTYTNSRSIFLRQRLPNGRYVVIPSTFDPDLEGRFLLRVYTDENNSLRELTKDAPVPCCFRLNPFSKYASCVTSLNVKSASKLQGGPFDSYVRILCEGKSVTGRPFKSSSNPEWETGAVFYRYKQSIPIIIEVSRLCFKARKKRKFLKLNFFFFFYLKIWIKKAFRDELYGSISLDAEPNNRHLMLQSNLNKSANDTRKNGVISIEVQSMTSLTAI